MAPRADRIGVLAIDRIGVLAIVDIRGRAADGTPSGFVEPTDAVRVTERLLEGGIRTIELRAKHNRDRERLELARALREATKRLNARLIVNDRPDIALLAEADGVHLGQTDLAARAVRGWLPPSMWIGVSCHSHAQARAVHAERSADYIGFGPVYPTASKRDPDPVVGVAALREICAELSDLPVVAIGGITIDRLADVRASGAAGAAMISGLLRDLDPRAIQDAAVNAVRQFSAP
jgi:thiamine-phosphate pyrophosphorylase